MPDNNNKFQEQSPQTFLKVCEFIGKVKEWKLETVYNKKSEHYGKNYLRCQVFIEKEPQIKEFLVWKEKESENIWKDIENREYLGKKYLFKLQRRPGAGQFWRLIDWEIIKNGKKK